MILHTNKQTTPKKRTTFSLCRMQIIALYMLICSSTALSCYFYYYLLNQGTIRRHLQLHNKLLVQKLIRWWKEAVFTIGRASKPFRFWTWLYTTGLMPAIRLGTCSWHLPLNFAATVSSISHLQYPFESQKAIAKSPLSVRFIGLKNCISSLYLCVPWQAPGLKELEPVCFLAGCHNGRLN